MTAVVLAGDFPSTGILQATVAQRFGLGGEETPPAFIDHMAYSLRERGAVLVIYPSWRAEEARRLVRLARSALLTDRIAGLPLDAPPLALSLIADQLTFASSYARPGVLASLAQRLCESIYAGAWVNSVARLEHIKTGLGAHVSSYLPGNGFSVSAGPNAAVHRITSAKPAPQPTSRPADPVLMLFSNENGDVEWLQQKLRPVIAAVSMTAVAAQPMSTEFWGTKKYAEFVAFSGHPQALQSLLAGSAYRPCTWCGEPTALAECPFCSMVQPGQDAASAARPSQGRTQPPTPPTPQSHVVQPQPPQAQPQPAQPQPPQPQQPQPPQPQQPQQAQPQPPQPPSHVPQPVRPQDPQPARPPAAHPQPPPPQAPRPAEPRPEYPEAPPTRPQVPRRHDGHPQPSAPPGPPERPQRPRSLHPHDPHMATPASEADHVSPPTRREPVLAAPVGPPTEVRGPVAHTGNGERRRNDRTSAQTPPDSWGNAAPPASHRPGEATASPAPAAHPEPADTPEPADPHQPAEPADTDAKDEPRASEDASFIEELLNGAAPQQAAAPAPQPERTPRTTPDDDWPRADTVVFRPRRPQ